mmetsp:Transcript_19234/g.35377  ORF Transcript_19234/g.35377 Transcript_19234/m.35377 type:complete len:384 (+) Transcript_19234:66-1217(+)
MSATMELINTGILMGIIHVLTGPDHLSALATLSGTNISNRRSHRDGFLLGIRWGLGHSLGILIVGSVLIAVEESSSEWIGMDDMVSTTLEGLVGVFMLALGTYGLHKAFRNRATAATGAVVSMAPSSSKESLRKRNDSGTAKDMPPNHRRASMEIVDQMSDVLNRDGDTMRNGKEEEEDDVDRRIFHAVESLRQNSDLTEDDDDEDQFLTTLKSSAKGALSRSFVNILYSHPPPMKASSLVHKQCAPENSIALEIATSPNCFDKCISSSLGRCITPSTLALVAGVVHGVAGPGGVLGVIPAVQLRNAKLASIYLITFCLTSTLVMGCFAACYGTFSEWLAGRGGSRNGKRVFLVEFGSAFLSIAVGIVWLVLLSVGKLEQVFP